LAAGGSLVKRLLLETGRILKSVSEDAEKALARTPKSVSADARGWSIVADERGSLRLRQRVRAQRAGL